jgi:site-specific recombinase XerD
MRSQSLEHNNRLWIAYRHDLKIRRLSAATVTNYFETLLDAERYFKTSFDTLTRLDIKAYLAEASERLADSSVHIRWVGLRAFFNWMISEDLMSTNPMTGVPEPSVIDNPPRIAPMKDIQALLKSVSGTSFRDRRDNALFRLMLEPGGMRRAEAIAMLVKDVDLDSELILIHGKGGKERYLPYGARTGQALMRYLHVRAKHKDAAEPALWLGRFGALTIYAIGQILKVRCDSAGIERINPHGLRHFAADRAMSAGISDLDLQTLFGWSSARMLAVYARSNRTARAIASARDKALGDDF